MGVSGAPKVRQQISPGQSGAVLRAAPPWVLGSRLQSASPERANNGDGCALSGLWKACTLVPGRRCALPWADLLRPLRGKINTQLQKAYA